jgi:hypothetical protein
MRAGVLYGAGDFVSLTVGLGIGASLLWRSSETRFDGVRSIIVYAVLGVIVLVLLSVEPFGRVFNEWL